MRQRLDEQWEKRKVLVGSGAAIFVVGTVALASFVLSHWDWTEFGDYTTKTTKERDTTGKVVKTTREIQSGKTLWDGLQLVGVPAALAIGGFWLNQREQKRAKAQERVEQKRAKDRERVEQEKANRREMLEKRQANRQEKLEKEQAKNREELEQNRIETNLREETLQAYLDRIFELLTNKALGNQTWKENPARAVARARTLTVLRSLDQDGQRKEAILRFIYEAELIRVEPPIISLKGADLTEINLKDIDLRNINLAGTDLRGADLTGADLSYAKLRGADPCHPSVLRFND